MQLGSSTLPLLPFQQNRSVVWGKDILIDDQPDRDQRNIAVCSAFNGWLFAFYSYRILPADPSNAERTAVFRSTDNGITWEKIADWSTCLQPTDKVIKMSLVTGGNSIDNSKIFLGWIEQDTLQGQRVAYVGRYNTDPFIPEELLLQDWNYSCFDISLATDNNAPAVNSNPFSFGLLYSKHSAGKDSVIFYSSNDGGLTIGNHKVLATSMNDFGNVSLCYGNSSSYPNGAYYACWEERKHSELYGHIYTAHSTPFFNSDFTTPVCLDSLDAASVNNCKNPVTACQYLNQDNDSANITQVVLFEQNNPGNNKKGISGFYNRKATTGSDFTKFQLTSFNNEIQPSVAYNPYDSTFMATYYSPNDKTLPFLNMSLNIPTPDNWNMVTPAYNDNSNLSAPYPRTIPSVGQQAGIFFWNAESATGNGISMFDGVNNTYNGMGNRTHGKGSMITYPNPCSSVLNVRFELDHEDEVTITLYDLTGRLVSVFSDRKFQKGQHTVQCGLSSFQDGCYLLIFNTVETTTKAKVVIKK